MSDANILINAYYEALYNKLQAQMDILSLLIDNLLRNEIKKRDFPVRKGQKYKAYKDACMAFVEERLEAYNPIGFQYTFDRITAHQAQELELQLNWYDSSDEFNSLLSSAYTLAEPYMTEEVLSRLVQQLINEFGAFPNTSIISGYESSPALNKLPDYIVALAIEKIIR